MNSRIGSPRRSYTGVTGDSISVVLEGCMLNTSFRTWAAGPTWSGWITF